MACKRSNREEDKLEAEILRLELKMACQMGVPGACEAAETAHMTIDT